MSESSFKAADEERLSRRARMTKTLIEDALLELLREKPLSAISVSELCREADVGRSTFYSHYDIVEDVFEEIIHRNTVGKLPALSLLGADARENLRSAHEQTKANREFFRVVTETNNLDTWLKNLIDSSLDVNTKAIRKRYPSIPKSVALQAAAYIVAGANEACVAWIEGEYDVNPATLTDIVHEMTVGAVAALEKFEQEFKEE